jgi:uncharacterized protein (TIGR03437 family)
VGWLLLVAAVQVVAQPQVPDLADRLVTLNRGLLDRPASPRAQLLAERSALLQELIRRDPSRALQMALPEDVLAGMARALPDQTSALEVRGKWSGIITQSIEDDFDHQRSRTRWWLNVGDAELDLRMTSPEPLSLRPGCTATAEGVRAGNMLAATRVSTSAAAAVSYCSALGEQKTAVLLTAFPNAPAPVYNVAAYRDLFFGSSGRTVSGFWRETSSGKTWATGEAFGPLTLDRSYSCDELAEMRAAAQAAAAAQGIDLSPYRRLFIYFPGTCPSWSGMGNINCTNLSTTWIPTGTGGPRSYDAGIAVHEGGHNLGLPHAFSRQYPVPLGNPYDGGSRTVYMDPFTAMGGYLNVAQYTAREKYQIEWLAPDEVLTTDQPGDYRLLPLASGTSGLKALRVPRAGTDGFFWIESRQALTESESGLPLSFPGGAIIHYEDNVNRDTWGAGDSDLLDFTPASRATLKEDFQDAYLTVGRTWVDDWTGLALTPLSEDPTGLTIRLGRATPCATFAESSHHHSPREETGTVQVVASSGCRWAVRISDRWLDSVSPASGEGSAKLTYRVSANTGLDERSAAIGLDNALFSVVQDGGGAAALQVLPSSGTGYAQTFTFIYHSPNGFANSPDIYASFTQGARYCIVTQAGKMDAVAVITEPMRAVLGRLGSQGSLDTRNCSLNQAASSVEIAGEYLYFRVALRFQSLLDGPLVVNAWTQDSDVTTTSRYPLGSWTVGVLPGDAPAFSLQGVVNVAGYTGGSVAPGETVAIFGTGLGPPQIVSATYDSSGRLGSTAGGTSVFFDDVQAPLVYASDGQISAIVPYFVSGQTRVRVEYQGRASNEVVLPVVAAVPGIFAYGGQNRAVAVNQGSSFNSETQPAARGEIVSFWATGEGPVQPTGIDGKLPVAPNWPQPAGAVNVTFGGVPGEVVFKGLVYAGVLQVSVKVPDNAPVGNAVAVVLSVAGAASPPATVALK